MDRTFTIRAAVHSDASDEEIDRYASGVEKIVNEAMAVYGEFPSTSPAPTRFWPTTCRTTRATAWNIATAPSSPAASLGNALSTASHEFFHCWNVERIRPQGLEPFNFEEANMTDSLWLAEGFTQYYGR